MRASQHDAELTYRLVAWVLRLGAGLMVLAGVAILVAGLPVYTLFSESVVARTIAGLFLQLSGALAVAGGAASWLLGSRRALLPNERATTSDAERPTVGGWLIVLAASLLAAPALMVFRLQSFLAAWRESAALLRSADLLEGANANMSGVVLLPIFAAMTPPLFELAAMSGFVVASAILLGFLLSRHPGFPRLYVVCVVLLTALVAASALGAKAAALAGEAAQGLMDGSSPDDTAQFRDGLNRYVSIVGSTAMVLVWTLCGYLVWAPAMFVSQRVRMTFAGRDAGQSATGDTQPTSPAD